MKVPMGSSVTALLFQMMAFHWSRMPTNQIVVLSAIILHIAQSQGFAVQLRTNQIGSWKTSHDFPPPPPPPPFCWRFATEKCHACAMATFAALYCAWLVRMSCVRCVQCWQIMRNIFFDFYVFVACIFMQYIVGLVHLNEWFFWPFLAPKSIHSNEPRQRCTASKCKQQKLKNQIKYSVIFRALHAPHTTRHPHQPSTILPQ